MNCSRAIFRSLSPLAAPPATGLLAPLLRR
jgi:hypothetical protein